MFHRLPFTVYYHLRYALPVLPVPGVVPGSRSKDALCVSIDIAPTVPMGYIRRTPNFFA